MFKFFGFVIIFRCFVCTALNFTDNQYIKHGGFLFSMPRILVSGKNHSTCLSLHDIQTPAKVTIEIKQKNPHTFLTKTMDSDHSCFEMFVPKTNIQEPHIINVKIQVQSRSFLYSAHNLDPVVVYPNKWIKTYIDTDKGIYKPGHKIRFRILVVDEKFMPVNLKIPRIAVKNPFDISVAVWEDVSLENGLVSLEYDMVHESLTGRWKIEAQGETKTFEVSKYVLPRFKAMLKAPQRIYVETNSFVINVCAHYSHTRPVNGLAFIKVTDSQSNMKSYNKLKEMENGCSEFILTSEDLSLTRKLSSMENKMHLHITGTVTEKGTNKIEIVFGKVEVDFQAYVMKFACEEMFRPGLPYNGKLTFNNVNVNLSREVVQICYNIAIKKSWNYVNDEQCSNFTLNEDNELDFQVLPMTRNVIHINFYAKSLNHSLIEDSFLAVRLFSLSNEYIQIDQTIQPKEPNECRPLQQFKITFTTDHFKDNETVTFNYMIKSNFEIFKLKKVIHHVRKEIPNYIQRLKNVVGQRHKYTKLGASADSFVIKFKLDKRVVKTYQFLVYYVNKNGETIAASKLVKVDPCLMKVTAKWNQNQMVPGSTVQLNISTKSQSLCSISAVDKSTKFLSPNHQVFKLDTLLRNFNPEERAYFNTSRRTCLIRDRKHKNIQRTWSTNRNKRHIYSFSEDYDAFDVFNVFGSLIITNLKVVSKSCYQGPTLKNTNNVQFLTQQYDDTNEDQVTSIRSQFSETWLWELIPVSGTIQLKRHLPHSITSYITNVLCLSETEGVGLSDELEITSFQNVFIEILTPHSVKREESFYLYIHLSNYRNYAIPIRFNLGMSPGLELDQKEVKLSASYCVLANNTATHKFKLKATMLGMVNVSVLAETDNQYPLHCGPETILFKRDSEIRSILVEPEGFRMKKTQSALLCTSGIPVTNNVTWNISVPSSIIPGTYKAHLTLNGEILGKTIENLDELLEIPTGCGEQIMATMAPNLYVLRYLNSTNSLRKTVKQKIIRNLKIGYQRILNYVHEDGSFSAFGYHDSMGSMFLTTFVVKILTQSKEYIYIDQHMIDKAITWIFKNQLENGCFNTMQHVFQNLGGASKENSTASLTSYVIISLIESNIPVPENVQTNARYCIRSQSDPDKYSLALNCYAMFLMKSHYEGNRFLQKLLALSEQQQNMVWWHTKSGNSSLASDVETTSYGLLALLQQNSSENMASALSVVRWLTSKYGARGSFVTTQDTVVALDALSRYLHLIESNNRNIVIYIQTPDSKHNLTLTNNDSLQSRRLSIKSRNGTISVTIAGIGCLLAQVNQAFNMKTVPTSEAFKFAMEVTPVSTINQCSISSLSPCLAYIAPDGPSNMAVMEISLPTGYQADRSSLYKLVEIRNTSKIEMFEENEDKISFYFTKLDKHLNCFSFNIHEHFSIEERKNALVKLYDYYNPEYELQQFYNISESCRKSQETSEILEIIETSSNVSTVLYKKKEKEE